jgi:hypothetical protein
MMIMICEMCKFEAPYDEIGVAIMAAHLKAEHGIAAAIEFQRRSDL